MHELLRRLHYLLNRRRLEAELADEMDFHRDMAARQGGAPFGNDLQLREQAREAWGWTWIERLSQDLGYGWRLLRKSRGFTAAAVLILAVGIGVNVAAFGFFNLMVLRPFPVRDPETLVRFQRSAAAGYASVLPYPEMSFIREHSTTLKAVLAWSPGTLISEGQTVKAHYVTSNYMLELGSVPRFGRVLDSRDDHPSAELAAVLSQGFWQRRFGGDPLVIGTTLWLNGKPVLVAGVAGVEFSGLTLDAPDVWLPLARQPELVEGSTLLTSYAVESTGVTTWGRLREGVNPEAAQAELRSLAASLRREHPNEIWENETLEATGGAYALSAINAGHHGTGRRGPNPLVPVAALAGALTLLILLAACGNLGGLLLARGLSRQREMSIRISIGAGRARLVRQLLTESLLLAALGAVAGVALGSFTLKALMSATGAPPWLDAAPDWRVVLFAMAMALVSAVLFGLVPALQVARQHGQAAAVRQVLIGAQVGASCVLLIVTAVLARGLNLASGHPGFNFRQVVAIDPGLAGHGFGPENARAYVDALQSSLRGAPAVRAVTLSTTPPFGRRTVTVGFEVAGRSIGVAMNRVDPDYFAAMQLPLDRGRGLMKGDSQTVVVSRSVARLIWPAEDPIGKPLDLAGVRYAVVGVSADSSAGPVRDPLEAFTLATAEDMSVATVLVAVSGPPENQLSALAAIAGEVDHRVRPEVQLMKASYERKLEGPRYSASAIGVLAAVALLLASAGIAGMISYSVSQRTREIGIRMALGARPPQVLSIVFGTVSAPVSAGLVAGIAGAAAISKLLGQAMSGIGKLDPTDCLAAVCLFAAVAGMASLMPARRALRVEPMRALRTD